MTATASLDAVPYTQSKKRQKGLAISILTSEDNKVWGKNRGIPEYFGYFRLITAQKVIAGSLL